MKKIAVLLTVLMSLFASSAFAQNFTDVPDTLGEGWRWTASNHTLTLSDNVSFDSIILPDGSKIVIPADKALTVSASDNTEAAAISCPGSLTIEGGGKLVINSKRQNGLAAKELIASNIEFAVDASINGILADGNGNDAAVSLINCTGSIKGGSRGIDVMGASVNAELKKCLKLTVQGSTNNDKGVNFPYSGIRVVSNVTGSHEAKIDIEDCVNVTLTGGTAIAMDAKINNSTNPQINTPVTCNIKNSSVNVNGYTKVYAAIFVNNYSLNEAGLGGGSVNIDRSNVTITAPYALGIMTSIHGANTQTNVKLTNSQVNFDSQNGVKSEDSGANGTAGIDMENSIIRMKLSGENPLLVNTKQTGLQSLPAEDRKGLLVLETPTQNTVTLYKHIVLTQDYEFPENAKFINANGYCLCVKPGVTLKIDGEDYYFSTNGCLIINPDGTARVSMGCCAGNCTGTNCGCGVKTVSSASMPETGDDSRLALWLCLMAASATIFTATVRRKAKG